MANNNDNKVLNVPNLRFPEFTEEWKKTTLGGIGNGFDYGMNAAAKQYDGENKYIRITDIDESSSCYNNVDMVSPDASLQDNYIVKNNDILLARTGASTGKSYLYNKNDGKLYFAGFLIRVNIPMDNAYFVFSQLHTRHYKKWVSVMSARSGQPGINSQEYSTFPLYTTSIEEQDKIARLLSLLDERIASQNKIIEDLKKLKLALCEKLILSHKKNCIVGSVCSIPNQIKDDSPTYDKILTVKLHCKGVCKSSAENLLLGATQYFIRRKGQLIYGKQNFHNGAIGIITDEFDGGITSKDIPSFNIYTSICNSKFLLHQLQSPQFYGSAETYTTGTGSKRLKEESFLRMSIYLPEINIQNRVANILNSIDKHISLELELQLAFLTQRKYLLQQMFI